MTSLDCEEIIKIVGKLIEETDVRFENIDYRVIGKYLAIHLSPEEIAHNNLKTVIPKRIKTGGPKPGMAYLDSDLDKKKQEKWSWKGKRKVPSNLQKKKLLARALEVAVKTILSNHLYQFDGRVYKQQSGGPIGLEITGVLARCAMLWWDRAYLKKLDQLKIDILLYLRYVDDSNLVLRALEPGTRFVNNQLSILKEAEEDDRGVPPDERTVKVLRTMSYQ